MTKPRRKPKTRFQAFLVEPQPEFSPTNWQQNPEHYRILEYIGPMHFKGRADAWKFLHNHDQLNLGTINDGSTNRVSIQSWAIYLDLDASIFETKPAGESSSFVSIQRQDLAPANAG